MKTLHSKKVQYGRRSHHHMQHLHHSEKRRPADTSAIDIQIVECLHLISLRFERISTKLQLLLGAPEFEIEMRKLVVDDRGNRAGFPKQVLTELLRLSALHTERYGHLT